MYPRVYLVFLRFKERRFRYVSEEGKEMIRRMLRINPNERPSADELMESGWFQRFVRSVPLPGNSLRRCLKELYYYHVDISSSSAARGFRRPPGSFSSMLSSHLTKNNR